MTAIELPRALRPWTEPLTMLDPVVHDGLGRWLHPLRSLLGPLAVPRSASEGEPDGYAGLHRRGSYERLLLSEWAVALEAPEEFLRRATAGEHVFIAPAFHEPQAASASVALLDAGPRQLGAPRLLHLALLVVLRQRAQDGGASFRFGVLQDPEEPPRELTPPAITEWMAHGTWQPTVTRASAWEARLAELAAPDVWLVGAADLLPLAQRTGAGLLEIEEVTHDGAPALRLRAHHRQRGSRAIILPLPPPDAGVRILRSPLAPPPPVPRPDRGHDAPPCTDRLGQLSCDGRRWVLPHRDGSAGALHVPNTTREQPGRTKLIMADHDLVLLAVDIKGKRPIAVAVSDEGEVVLRGSGLALGEGPPSSISTEQHTGLLLPVTFQRPSRGLELLTMFVVTATALVFDAWILDAHDQLWELRIELQDSSHRIIRRTLDVRDRGCRSLWRLDADTVAWLSDSQQRMLSSPRLFGNDHVLAAEERAQCVISPMPIRKHRALRFAVPHGNALRVHDFDANGQTTQDLVLPPGRAFGLRAIPTGAPSTTPVALYVSPDWRGVCTQQRSSGDHLLFTTSSRIQQIRYEPACDKIVWRTEHGELGIYDPFRRQMLRRISPQGITEDEP
ncbi:hypothetical protein [Paraliomyxa miuraensis]|uniref:hypothetical protein n=1 Tax=Paraliomyxa miuraensis TaxID=376150 RepID=UPI00225B8D6D|nr:hypothetical protein [Paraliomyxa miuraensis]MCX4246147.1 hypothetical protein [Paraliomyxa miuraensis]